MDKETMILLGLGAAAVIVFINYNKPIIKTLGASSEILQVGTSPLQLATPTFWKDYMQHADYVSPNYWTRFKTNINAFGQAFSKWFT